MAHASVSAPEQAHAHRVARLVEAYRSIPADAPVRLAKRTSNLFRERARSSAPRLDVTGFERVLHVDPVRRTADVEGMVTYEKLVDATLPYGLMPLVVPQLKTITLGGAVTGLGIESSSFRNGLPHESVLEMEMLTGDGARGAPRRRTTSTPNCSRAFPNSYGTLGYALRLTHRARAGAAVRHAAARPPHDAGEFFADLDAACDGAGRVDFVDGTDVRPATRCT